jgi:hypothetical protein
MTERLDPESVDLAELTRVVRTRCGSELPGEIVGKTRIRDEVAAHLACSELEAELLVDTMVGRGFAKRRELPDGLGVWQL